MDKTKSLKKQIDELRIRLHQLIEEDLRLTDSKVIQVSKMLDELLNEYHDEDNSQEHDVTKNV